MCPVTLVACDGLLLWNADLRNIRDRKPAMAANGSLRFWKAMDSGLPNIKGIQRRQRQKAGLQWILPQTAIRRDSETLSGRICMTMNFREPETPRGRHKEPATALVRKLLGEILSERDSRMAEWQRPPDYPHNPPGQRVNYKHLLPPQTPREAHNSSKPWRHSLLLISASSLLSQAWKEQGHLVSGWQEVEGKIKSGKNRKGPAPFPGRVLTCSRPSPLIYLQVTLSR